jgi:hypothetical protein
VGDEENDALFVGKAESIAVLAEKIRVLEGGG